RIEVDGASETVGGVGQVNECRREIAFSNRRVQVLGVSASDTLDEVDEVFVLDGRVFGRAGFVAVAKEGFVRVVTGDGEIAFRAVVKVADGSGFAGCGAEVFLRRVLG